MMEPPHDHFEPADIGVMPTSPTKEAVAVEPERPPSYHDLYITTETIPRTSIFNLPYDFVLTCCRVAGWTLWHNTNDTLVAGEYDTKGLRLDVKGVVIVDSLTNPNPYVEDEGPIQGEFA